MVLLVLLSNLLAGSASGFTITGLGWGANVQLRPDDIAQDGAPLSAATEQVLSQGTLQANLTDFSIPIDVNLSGALSGGLLTTRINRTYAFMVRLSRAERNRCVGAEDLDIDLSIVGPVRDAFAANGVAGGMLELVRFDPVYRGAWGRRCPSTLFFGYTMDLSVANAVSAGTYEATAEIAIVLAGAGGSTQAIQVPLQVQMPGLLLLYHHNRINVDLDATALAGVLGADRACSGGFCMSLGNRRMPVMSLGGTTAVDIGSAISTVVPVQTITLQNAVGVRATGCSNNRYDTATFQTISTGGGVQPTSGAIPGIQGASCGLDLRTGDLSIDLDLSQVDAVTGIASATIQITVTGL